MALKGPILGIDNVKFSWSLRFWALTTKCKHRCWCKLGINIDLNVPSFIQFLVILCKSGYEAIAVFLKSVTSYLLTYLLTCIYISGKIWNFFGHPMNRLAESYPVWPRGILTNSFLVYHQRSSFCSILQ